MPLAPIEAGVVEQSQAELQEKFSSGSDVPQLNVEIVQSLTGVGRFEYPAGSDNWFSVPTVPYKQGLKLKDLYLRIKLARAESDAGMHYVYEQQLREMLDIAWSLCVPEKRYMRVMRRLLPWINPLSALASEGDISALLSFFLVRRMKSNVSFHLPAMDHQ